MGTIVKSEFCASNNHNYLIAGTLCNAFVLGETGSLDDFFLVGSDPGPNETTYPLLTGNILDSEGNVLFRLVRNCLVINPGNCSKIVGNRLGYEIHDSADKPILKIETRYQPLGNTQEPRFTTTLAANFYNKKGELVFQANSGEADEKIEANCKTALGFTGTAFGAVMMGMSQDEITVAAYAVGSGGFINRVIREEVSNGEMVIDGNIIMAEIHHCKIHVITGNFAIIPPAKIHDCQFEFHGQADNIYALALSILRPPQP